MRLPWALVMFAVMFVALSVGGAVYTTYERQQSDRRWCALLAIQAAASPPPQTERGRASQREARRLLRQFGCEGGP